MCAVSCTPEITGTFLDLKQFSIYMSQTRESSQRIVKDLKIDEKIYPVYLGSVISSYGG